MKRSLGRGGHPTLPKTEPVLLPPSLPSMAEWPLCTWRSPQSNVLLRCSCARRALLPGRVINVSYPRPVSSCPCLRPRLTGCSVHSDPTLGRCAFRIGSLCSALLPHCGYICSSSGPTCMVSGSLASAPWAICLAHSDQQDPQVQGSIVQLTISYNS